MSSNNNIYNCRPVKQHPIIYKAAARGLAAEMLALDQPMDLSLKRKAPAEFDNYAMPENCEFALNLTKSVKRAIPELPKISCKFYAKPPVYMSSKFSASKTVFQTKLQQRNVYPLESKHMHSLHPATAFHTTINSYAHPYEAAFMLSAGCNPINATLSHSYQPSNLNAFFPTPASSINSNSAASTFYAYNYQQITPPSSPGSEGNSEPEDLSVRSDIPLSALLPYFDTAPTTTPGASYNGSSSYTATKDANNHHHPYNGVVSSLHPPSSTSTSKNYRFQCQSCDNIYSTSTGLWNHQQFHCPVHELQRQQHRCQHCDKLYATNNALKMHMSTHTLPYQCTICGKAFSRQWLLQGHIRTHTGEKPFRCSKCLRSFADRSNLRAHQQIHVDIKKYACKVCQKSFSRINQLNKHVNFNCNSNTNA